MRTRWRVEGGGEGEGGEEGEGGRYGWRDIERMKETERKKMQEQKEEQDVFSRYIFSEGKKASVSVQGIFVDKEHCNTTACGVHKQ